MDDGEEYEAGDGIEYETVFTGESEPAFVSNDDWVETSLKWHPLDLGCAATALAANMSTAFSVFFKDVRRDMMAARNRATKANLVQDFDRDLLGLNVPTVAED